MLEYIAVIYKDPDHGYAVKFPDFPGLITYAAFLEGAPDVAASHLTILISTKQNSAAPLCRNRHPLRRSHSILFTPTGSPPSV